MVIELFIQFRLDLTIHESSQYRIHPCWINVKTLRLLTKLDWVKQSFTQVLHIYSQFADRVKICANYAYFSLIFLFFEFIDSFAKK